ncbi:MAG: MFS transporter [Cellulomonadaceae bacterium]|nr:MFS transporter [Cellulomonadaceae bacterium]
MHNKNKYKNGIVPMTLINFAIGSVYCWTLFTDYITREDSANFSPAVTAWAFSLALFILGMAAAFGGRLVERNPKRSAWLTALFFTTGWLLTGISIQFSQAWLLILGFGLIQGIGLGLGYITPVKTMMIWGGNRKGLFAAMSITAFGLAGVIANPIIQFLLDSGLTPYQVFYVLTVVYGICIVVGAILLHRPEMSAEDVAADAAAGTTSDIKPLKLMRTPKFAFLWLILFINITGGLALISHERQIYYSGGHLVTVDPATNIPLDVIYQPGGYGQLFTGWLILIMITATANLLGRIIFGYFQDYMKEKHTPYYPMIAFSIVATAMAALTANQSWSVWTSFALVFTIQFMFGVGFACNPEILRQNWGMKNLSTIQGLMLTAWAFAGLAGNQISNFIFYHTDLGRQGLFWVLCGLYGVQAVCMAIWLRYAKEDHRKHPESHGPEFDAAHVSELYKVEAVGGVI